MNEKTTKQNEEMMNQTIGVEVEMNNITRAKRDLSPVFTQTRHLWRTITINSGL